MTGFTRVGGPKTTYGGPKGQRSIITPGTPMSSQPTVAMGGSPLQPTLAMTGSAAGSPITPKGQVGMGGAAAQGKALGKGKAAAARDTLTAAQRRRRTIRQALGIRLDGTQTPAQIAQLRASGGLPQPGRRRSPTAGSSATGGGGGG